MADRPTSRAKPRRTARLAAPGPFDRLKGTLSHPAFVPAMGIWLLLLTMCVGVLALSRGRLLVSEGRVLDETRTVRVPIEVIDQAATERDRAARALSVPRVYVADEGVLKELEASLSSLPSALETAGTVDEVAAELQSAFALSPDSFSSLRSQTRDEQGRALWSERVARLMNTLAERPVLSSDETQLALSDPASRMELKLPGGLWRNVSESAALSVSSDNTAEIRSIVRDVGFVGSAASAVAHRVATGLKPTFVFDKTETDLRRGRASATAPDVKITYRAGEVLARRGDVLNAEQLTLIRTEHDRFRATMPFQANLAQWIGIIGVAAVVASAFGVYVRLFYAEIALRPARFLGLTLVMGLGAAGACWSSVSQPGWLWATAVTPVVFTTMVAVIAFEARLGLATAAATGVLVGAALGLPVGYFAVIISAAGLAAWKLREVRSRNDVVRAAVVVGAGVALAVFAVNMLSRPLVAQGPTLWREVLQDAGFAGIGAFMAGAMTLVFLPTLERLFDVTTGMTLSEWRDPKQPLLRKLQLQAPGTSNHSHIVATLAESAAEAIGANGLHVYVGALYHDIGKMNKPDYFVENQPKGFNRHTKLSPAMSLLVIVGHVKDGVELAKDYKLPRSLLGYIETHHGTTLVEYFYDQARRQAEEGEGDEPPPQEIEYRYPGPKPQTKEQAILMLCDAVESATRAMPEPTPSRIQTLVHQLATKRLMDGQFDSCGLTLSELSKIEEALTRTLSSIYHGRIAYPSTEAAPRGAAKDPSESRSPLAEQAG